MIRCLRATVVSAVLLAGCAPPMPDDPQTLFTLPAHAERLRDSGDTAALAGLVAIALDRNGPAIDCNPHNAPGRGCAALMRTLASDGPPAWPGSRLDAGHVEEITRKLGWSGWRCPPPRGAIGAGDALRLADDLAWLDCDGGELLDASVSIGLALDDASTTRLQVGFRGDSVAVELQPHDLADEPDDAEMIVRGIDGRLHRIQLDYRATSPQFRLPDALGELDAPSNRRVLRAARQHRDRFVATLRDGDPLPQLQIAERAADILSRLPAALLRDALDEISDTDPVLRASVLFARCRSDSAEASRACLMGALLQVPLLVDWLPSALDEAERRNGPLPAEHPVRRHFVVLREALEFAGAQ
jgi:hypothetical protein